MNSYVHKNSQLSISRLLGGTAAALLLIGSGLSLFVRLTLRQLDVTTVFAMLAFGAWSLALGVAVLALLSVWLIVGWARHGSIIFLSADTSLQNQGAMDSKTQSLQILNVFRLPWLRVFQTARHRDAH
ncbi:MAG: hypothetical protein U0236_03155 [Nitrospira sp.]